MRTDHGKAVDWWSLGTLMYRMFAGVVSGGQARVASGGQARHKRGS